MIKVVPYIQTIGCERFKEFLTVPFSIDMLASITNDKSVDVLFDGWRGKNMMNWYKFTDDDNNVLEFYANYYNIKTKTTSNQFPIPKTIGDFINDMTRINIQLYWSEWMNENFEPKEYFDKDEISNYYADLLNRIGKSFEV